MTEIQVSIVVACDNCGRELEARMWRDQIHVKPCSKCFDEAQNEGYEEGKKDGIAEATP